MSVQITTAEQFKSAAFKVIPLPPFSEGAEPIYIQIKATGVMNMIANGRIPNTLLGKVTELFGESNSVTKDNVPAGLEGITDEQKQNALNLLSSKQGSLQDMAELLRVFAEATMVQPQYEEVKDFMTDAQLMAIFEAMYGEVKEAESFR